MPTGPVDLSTLREEYARGGLDLSDATPEPYELFARWLAEAIGAGVHEPNAIVLATVSPDGQPSARMVLLKGVDDGFVFYTNQSSRKGAELDANPRCAVVVPWHPLQRQVRVEGVAQKVGETEADAYFARRPRGAQIGAWASPQSQVVASRAELTDAYGRAQERFADGPVPRPPHWGGYRVRPHVVEFWQGRPDRMHDRLRYEREGEGWRVVRLAP